MSQTAQVIQLQCGADLPRSHAHVSLKLSHSRDEVVQPDRTIEAKTRTYRNGDRMIEQDEINRITEKIIGAAIEVHRALGPGPLESAYQVCLCHELTLQGLGLEARRRYCRWSTRVPFLTAATESTS